MLDFCIKDLVSERSAVKSLQSNMWFLLGMFRCGILQVNSPGQKIGGGNVTEVYGVHRLSFPRFLSVPPEGRFSVFRGKSTVGVVAFGGEGILTTENTETRFAGHGRRLMKGVVPLLQPRFQLVVVDGDGLKISVAQERDPPEGGCPHISHVRTPRAEGGAGTVRAGFSILPGLRPVNTEHVEARRHGELF